MLFKDKSRLINVPNYPLSIWLGVLNSKVYQTHQMAKKLALSGSIYYDRPQKKHRLFCLALLDCIVLYSLLQNWFSKLGHAEFNATLLVAKKTLPIIMPTSIRHGCFLSCQFLTDIIIDWQIPFAIRYERVQVKPNR